MAVILAIAIGFCTPGCSIAYAATQNVWVRVRDAQRGMPVREAVVIATYDYERTVPPDRREPEDLRPETRSFAGVTGEEGGALLSIKLTSPHDVTGTMHAITVLKGADQESFAIRMEPGQHQHGALFDLTITHVDAPVRIDYSEAVDRY